jgi:apolipoprotein N-acyltransferase
MLGMCQIADVTGAYGVSFWLVAVNALLAVAWLNRAKLRPVLPAAIVVASMLIAIGAYGLFRIAQTPSHLSPGPTVAVVQGNYPQSNSGAKGASLEDLLKFHEDQTNDLARANPGKLDLAVWSETMVAPLNQEALEYKYPQSVYQSLSELTARNHLALITGGEYEAKFVDADRDGVTYRIPKERRNSAYFFDKSGSISDLPGHRYDKTHLVPFGEFIPFKHTMPLLYNIFIYLGPKYYSDYDLQSGNPDNLTVFQLSGENHAFRFVTPICFEDIDPRICADMFRPDKFASQNDGGKRADFLVNLTNDGWFIANENAQHLQAAIFRCIENRAPAARSVNTGISGFIDSTGQPFSLLPVRTFGSSVAQLQIDNRLTLYTRFGDLFAEICVTITAIIALTFWAQRFRKSSSNNMEAKQGS